nr:MAG: hypothetical protein [Microvirus sp.]
MSKKSIIYPVFRTQWNNTLIPTRMEYNSHEVVTVPDMTLTISEILTRFGQGQTLPIGQRGNFEEDPDFDNINPMSLPDRDLSDITEMSAELQTLKPKVEAKKQGRNERQTAKDLERMPEDAVNSKAPEPGL